MILPEIPSEILRQPLPDWQDSTQEILSEALSLHGKGEEVGESLSAYLGEEERERVKLGNVPEDQLAMCHKSLTFSWSVAHLKRRRIGEVGQIFFIELQKPLCLRLELGLASQTERLFSTYFQLFCAEK